MKAIVAKCGFRCDRCPAYAPNIRRRGDQRRVSALWARYFGFTVDPAKIRCDGCQSKQADAHLLDTDCPVRPCATRRKLENCAGCDKYLCDRLASRATMYQASLGNFVSEDTEPDHPAALIPYLGDKVLDQLRAKKRLGPRYGCFSDKRHPPALEGARLLVGHAQPAWDRVLRLVAAHCAAAPQRKFYGRNYGWAFQFKKSGRALVTLLPHHDRFTVLFVLSEPETNAALALSLLPKTKKAIKQATAYPEGRWVFLPVTLAAQVVDVERLLLARGPSRQLRKK